MSDPIEILVVDDRPENLLAMEAMLDDPELRIITVDSGEGALEACLDHDFALILLDVQMPGMDGFETARHLRNVARTRFVPIIFVTANNRDMQHVFEGYDSGAVDYLFKPVEPEVVINKVHIFKDLYQNRVAVEQKNRELDAAYRSIQADIDAAAEIQRSMLPNRCLETPRIHSAWKFRPCEVVGGDLFNIVEPQPGKLVMYLLDVSGHGVQAALKSTALGYMLASVSREDSIVWNFQGTEQGVELASPAEVAKRLNEHFPMDTGTCQYFTLLYGMLDLESLLFTYISAGHPLPVRIEKTKTETPQISNPPIGWMDSAQSLFECTVQLEPGDRMYVYSDGIPEARNTEGEEFGEEQLQRFLQARTEVSLEHSLDQLEAEVLQWSGTEPQDDLSVLAIEVRGG